MSVGVKKTLPNILYRLAIVLCARLAELWSTAPSFFCSGGAMVKRIHTGHRCRGLIANKLHDDDDDDAGCSTVLQQR
jgi:hypothetical protein